MKPLCAIILLGSLWFAVGAPAAPAATRIQASHAWIRVLPGDLPAGGYVTLANRGEQPLALTGASGTAYAQVMLHHSSTQGGMSRMTMVDALPIPAHGEVVLAPAGYHLMLMRPATPVKPGDRVQLLLKFSDGSTLPVEFIARPANALDDGATRTAHPDS